MKLENNSLKYGMNAYNGVQGAYNNAYQQEMENQRNMQTQVTERQKTLLSLLNSEHGVGTDIRGGGQTGGIRGAGGSGGNIQATPSTVASMNTNVFNAKDPYERLEVQINQSMPKRMYIDEAGDWRDKYSDRGFSYVAPNIYSDKQIQDYSMKYNVSPQQAVNYLYPQYAAPLPEWNREKK